MTDKAFEDWWRLLKPAECDEVEEHFRECWQAATLDERERCAKVCETFGAEPWAVSKECADAIRALPDGGT